MFRSDVATLGSLPVYTWLYAGSCCLAYKVPWLTVHVHLMCPCCSRCSFFLLVIGLMLTTILAHDPDRFLLRVCFLFTQCDSFFSDKISNDGLINVAPFIEQGHKNPALNISQKISRNSRNVLLDIISIKVTKAKPHQDHFR